jgi:TP901 family phage tail tape measure protein
LSVLHFAPVWGFFYAKSFDMASKTEQRKIQIIADGTQVNASMEQMSKAARVLWNELRKLPETSEEFAQKSEEYQKVKSRLDEATASARGTESALDGLKKQSLALAGAFGIAFGIQSVFNFFKTSSNAAKEFEKALSGLSALTGAVGEDLEFYRREAELIGQTTTLSAAEAVEAFQIMGGAVSSLMDDKQVLADVTKEVVTLAEASGDTLPAAAQAMASAMNMFGLEASEAGRIINALAAGSTAGAAEVPDLTAAIDKAGLTARNFNVSIEESVALTELLAEGNLKGAEAGTALRNVLLKMQTIEALPKKALQALSEFGVNLTVVSDKTIPLEERLTELSKISGDATAMVKVFGVENVTAGNQILQNIPKYLELNKAVTGTSTAYEQAATRTDNLAGDFKSLDSVIESIQIGIGTFLNAALRPLIQGFIQFLLMMKEIPSFIKENREYFIALGVAVITLNGANIAATASTLAHLAAEKGRAVATQASAVAQRVLNAAMSANPIGLIIAGVGALVAVLINLYRTNDKVRATITGLWAAANSAFTGIKDSAMDILGGVGDLLLGIFTFDKDKIQSGWAALTTSASEIGEKTVEAYRASYTDSMKDANEEISNVHQEGADQVIAIEEGKIDQLNELEEESEKERKARLKREADERKKLQEDFAKKEMDARKAMEDLELSLMDEGTEKKLAKLRIEHQRSMQELDAQREEVLANTAITEEQRSALLENYRLQEDAKDAEYKKKKEEIEEEDRIAKLEKDLTALTEEEAIKTELVEQQFMNAMNADFERNQARLELEKNYVAQRLAILEAAGKGETSQAEKLRTTLQRIDKDIADNKIAEAQRAEDYKKQVQEAGLEATRGFLQLGLEMLEENSKARKTVAIAMKAFEIGKVVTDGISEIAGYWKANSGVPIVGPALAAALTAGAVVRTALAVNKIKSTKYAHGGATGSGKVIDMVMGRNGTWQMPNGQSARDVGSFARGGHVGSASFGVIGEAGHEWVGPNWMLRSPKYANIFGYLEAERRKVTPFAAGGNTAPAPQLPQNSSATADLQHMLVMIEQFGAMNDKLDQMISILQEWPVNLRVYNDPRDIVDGVRVLNEIENDSRINR